jgi:thiol:disulfide interchange protein
MKLILRLGLVLCMTSAAMAQGLGGFDPLGPSLDPLGGQGGGIEQFRVQAVASHTRVTPGQSFYVAAEVSLEADWVWYAAELNYDGDFPFQPARMEVQAEGLAVGEILWPPDQDYAAPTGSGTAVIRVYKDSPIVYVPLSVPAEADLGETYRITLRPQGQICSDSCIPLMDIAASTRVTVGEEALAGSEWENSPRFRTGLDEAHTLEELRAMRSEPTEPAAAGESLENLAVALLLAALAGVLLNVMPCVLPVIPIRILTIVEMGGQSRRRFVTLGLSFAGGMMAFFLLIAAINIVLKLTTGEAFDLNRMFQFEAFRILMVVIVVALAANLFGVFNVVVPSRVAQLDSDVQAAGKGHARSFGMGVMMAVLALPCSFAFLASAMLYAQTHPLWEGTLVILTIGLGMSAPHALLVAFPTLVDKLPRPGRWMELFKQSTGFVLLLVGVWLLATLRGDAGSYPYWVLAWCVLLVGGLWMWANWVRYDAPLKKKLLVRGVAVALVAGAGAWMLSPPAEPLVKGRDFDLSAIEQARSEGKVVVVKFTATWCTKCIQQDYSVFNTPEVAEVLNAEDVLYVKGDVTDTSSSASQWLRPRYGLQIPLTLVYPPQGEHLPPLRSDLTPEILLKAIEQARSEEPS